MTNKPASLHTLIAVACLSLLSACASMPVDQQDGVSLMTFNVENLFDTSHDADKDDFTYLPTHLKDNDKHRARCVAIPVKKWRTECQQWDWNERVLKEKLSRVAAVIREGSGEGTPDIIVFQEVENLGVLQRLRDEFLADLGYLPPVLIEGVDLRGIDVAFLSRLPLYAPAKLHPIDYREIKPRALQDTRGILQGDFVLPDGQILTVYGVHFPAPFHPYPLRIDSYTPLNRLVNALPPTRLAVAAGDFNTPAAEDREQDMLQQHVKEYWMVAHQEGCQSCPGTHYYAPKKEWSFLDMILVRRMPPSAGRQSLWELQVERTRLGNQGPHQIDENGYPERWSLDGPTGVSDHWPLVIEVAP